MVVRSWRSVNLNSEVTELGRRRSTIFNAKAKGKTIFITASRGIGESLPWLRGDGANIVIAPDCGAIPSSKVRYTASRPR